MRRRLVDERTGYGVVLLLLAVTYVVSVSGESSRLLFVVLLVQLAAVRMVLLVSRAGRALRRTTDVVLLALAVATAVALLAGVQIHPDAAFTRFIYLVSALLYGLAPLSIIRDVINRRVVDDQTLLAAIAAYLMFGMFFAFTYRFVGAIHVQPFFGTTGADTGANYLFFSFVTLTTTGYGNLVPAGNPGQTLAVGEAIVGQLFLVIAVAKVVGEMGVTRLGRSRAEVERSEVPASDPAAEPESP